MIFFRVGYIHHLSSYQHRKAARPRLSPEPDPNCYRTNTNPDGSPKLTSVPNASSPDLNVQSLANNEDSSSYSNLVKNGTDNCNTYGNREIENTAQTVREIIAPCVQDINGIVPGVKEIIEPAPEKEAGLGTIELLPINPGEASKLRN